MLEILNIFCQLPSGECHSTLFMTSVKIGSKCHHWGPMSEFIAALPMKLAEYNCYYGWYVCVENIFVALVELHLGVWSLHADSLTPESIVCHMESQK